MTEIGAGEVTGGLALAALAVREAFNFIKGKHRDSNNVSEIREAVRDGLDGRYAVILENQTRILSELVSSHRELSNNLVKFMAFTEGRGGFRDR